MLWASCRAICVHRFSHRFHSKADLFSHNFPRLTQNICASRPHTVPNFPRDFPKKSVQFCMPTPCATHLDCAKNSDMLSSIESLVVQKALSDAARVFCDPSHFSKASVVARRSRDPCHNHFFFESAPNTRLSRFSNSKASDAALCPPCLHLAISCQLPLAKHSNPKKKQTCLFPRVRSEPKR
jgi:hypothetical protein